MSAIELAEDIRQTCLKTSLETTKLFSAMLPAAKEMPDFAKKDNSYLAKYCKLETIQAEITPILLKYDLLLIQSPGKLTQGIKITASVECVQYSISVITRIQHISGQYIESICEMPLPTGKQTNISQEAGIAITYARRYMICALLNLNIHGEDFDGANPQVNQKPMKEITEEEAIKQILTIFEADQKGNKVLGQEYIDKWMARINANKKPKAGWVVTLNDLSAYMEDKI